MKKQLLLTAGLLATLITTAAQATLLSVSGPNSSDGIAASIISAPLDVRDDAAYNQAQQGFNEIQGYTLLSDLSVDGGNIAAGTLVDSHMIFLNSGPGNDPHHVWQFNVDWMFDGEILGVMSNYNGSLEINSSDFLGAVGTIYPDMTFGARGIETNPATCNMNTNDCYIISGNTLSLSMNVTEPGDWIRVITASRDVPAPAPLALLALGLVGLAASRRKQHAA